MLRFVRAIVAGVVVLARAADVFVLGAAALSLRLGLSALVVGAVVSTGSTDGVDGVVGAVVSTGSTDGGTTGQARPTW